MRRKSQFFFKGDHDDVGSWLCSRCTLVNKPSESICGACLNPKDDEISNAPPIAESLPKPPPKPEPKHLGNEFVKHYYTQFSTNRANLASLYQDSSMLSFNGFNAIGRDQIMTCILAGLHGWKLLLKFDRLDLDVLLREQPHDVSKNFVPQHFQPTQF